MSISLLMSREIFTLYQYFFLRVGEGHVKSLIVSMEYQTYLRVFY